MIIEQKINFLLFFFFKEIHSRVATLENRCVEILTMQKIFMKPTLEYIREYIPYEFHFGFNIHRLVLRVYV